MSVGSDPGLGALVKSFFSRFRREVIQGPDGLSRTILAHRPVGGIMPSLAEYWVWDSDSRDSITVQPEDYRLPPRRRRPLPDPGSELDDPWDQGYDAGYRAGLNAAADELRKAAGELDEDRDE